MKEQDILLPALDRLTEIAGITAKILSYPSGRGKNSDAVIELIKGQQTSILEADVKTEVRTATLDNIILRQDQTDGRRILIAKYIPTPMKEELRKHSICYIETSGNCYIETRSMFILVSDQKTAQPKFNEDTKLWAPAGIKFLFAVLQEPEILNTSYRNMAYASGVALGNVGNFITEMKRDGYIIMGTRLGQPTLILENKTAILDKWADMYRTVLRPKQLVGKFRFAKKEDRTNWHEHTTQYDDILWGGETAGEILTGHLVPEIYTIYSNSDRFELMKRLRLVPATNGDVEILRPFWNQDTAELGHGTVPPMLAYAELISSLDSRNREIALRIKEKYVG
ncbi:type IV toxin-antitoxin system AbiEi family antitoxin [Pedobacter jeongneungensis]